MAKAKDIHDPKSIDLHIQKLEQPLAQLVAAIRHVIQVPTL
jgi:hypothetical protein